ncbi:MAG: RNA methyltransferase [Bacteroidales bacterium]
MLSKAKIKFIRSLDQKKERLLSGLFLAEGNKLVFDTLPFFKCRLLVATKGWLAANPDAVSSEIVEATPCEIATASLLQSPQDVIAVYEMPQYTIDPQQLKGELVLALDGVQDPGNMGTIIRTADWYGINTVLCSVGCADIYNPKTVQSTMGALARVRVVYVSLSDVLPQIGKPVLGTFLDGENIYSAELDNDVVIVMGNEGRGISDEIAALVTRKIFIPPFPVSGGRVESLNVAVATAVTCAEFRRRIK